MAQKAIITGAALIVLGVVVSIASDSSSVTSLLPAILGVVFVVLGLVARARPDIAHHLMHGAAALAVLAMLGSIGSALGRGSTGWALFAQVATAVIAGVFLWFAVQSFRHVRQEREAGQPS